MCGICGCSGEGARIEGAGLEHADHGPHSHDHGDGHAHGADGAHDHQHEHEHVLPDGRVIRHTHGHSHADEPAPHHKARLVAVERNILERNAANAQHNRAHFAAHRLVVLNLVSSPGSGKTTLLVETIKRLHGVPTAVIEGDQQTSLDADRIRSAGAPAVQINTGKGCHLEADQVGIAFQQLHHLENGVLFIENVGNLVCPASFDLGETHRVVLASVSEGDDKPLKYPDMFASADLLIVSKIDIAEACGSDVDVLIANARKVRPGLPALRVSTRSGEGMDRWIAWITAAQAMRAAGD
jgi:hydrogenase nickel incorporation protein HypB